MLPFVPEKWWHSLKNCVVSLIHQMLIKPVHHSRWHWKNEIPTMTREWVWPCTRNGGGERSFILRFGRINLILDKFPSTLQLVSGRPQSSGNSASRVVYLFTRSCSYTCVSKTNRDLSRGITGNILKLLRKSLVQDNVDACLEQHFGIIYC